MSRKDVVVIFWYDHDCDYISSFCEEHHKHWAKVIKSELLEVIEESEELFSS